jgi:hypothetical protein
VLAYAYLEMPDQSFKVYNIRAGNIFNGEKASLAWHQGEGIIVKKQQTKAPALSD